MASRTYQHKHNYHFRSGRGRAVCITNAAGCCLVSDWGKVTCKACLKWFARHGP